MNQQNNTFYCFTLEGGYVFGSREQHSLNNTLLFAGPKGISDETLRSEFEHVARELGQTIIWVDVPDPSIPRE
ncbi:MAG: hypothetical protein GC190_19145 [Alphaproteobacteria bacterium]|nr:hypothetical protein [Alphaproteobacteria bacterium]